MSTNRITKLDEINLSVTAKMQENYDITSGHKNNSENSKLQENGDNSFSQLHDCSGNICSTTWKPIQSIA